MNKKLTLAKHRLNIQNKINVEHYYKRKGPEGDWHEIYSELVASDRGEIPWFYMIVSAELCHHHPQAVHYLTRRSTPTVDQLSDVGVSTLHPNNL